jgi:prophage regulatory protein
MTNFLSAVHEARILRMKQTKERTGLSRSTLYTLIKEGKFPAPISLGARAVGWLSSDVDAWIESRIKADRVNA